jgi:hypothetical protein
MDIKAKLDLSDRPVDEFPQNRYLNGLIALGYQNSIIDISTGFRNTLFGSGNELTLFPAWNPSGYYTRSAQYQSQIEAGLEVLRANANVYTIHKYLRAVPTEYTYDFNTDTMIATELPERGLDDVYYGAEIQYPLLPYLTLSGFTALKQANFDPGNIYSVNTAGATLQTDLPLNYSSRIVGSFSFQNRQADYLPDLATNLFVSSLRLQKRLGTNLNGFVNYINNGCSDSELGTFYFISHQLRSQVQYSFAFDESMASYIFVGGKYSPENDANAAFMEVQSRLVSKVYALAGFKNQIDNFNTYQAKVSYFFNPVSDFHLQYLGSDFSPDRSTHHYLGVGSSVYF